MSLTKRIFSIVLFLVAIAVLVTLITSCSPLAQIETPSPTAQPAPGATARGETVSPLQTPTPAPDTCTVTAYTLNVRAGAGMRYAVKWILEHGERVTVRRVAGDWLFVTTGETAGYIHSHYCETGE